MSATINYDYYDKKNIYDDGEVEETLYNHYKNKDKIDDNRDDIFYLTTDIRENIISWYPLSKDSKVLEVGAGVGTITGKLCDMCSEVTAMEASKRRAEIIYERHKDRDNLKVVVANIQDYKTDEKFDYIILIGVYEYSKLFFNNDKPYDYFLNILKKKLNKNGKIIIAIENRYGIKYWAGNNEDHLGVPYKGFYGYQDVERVQTFGKEELIKLFKDNGFNNYRFYYAFPDYKMPQLILTDDHMVEEYELNSLPVYNMNLSDNYNFNPRKVLYGLQVNKQLGFFANSFICEISPDNCELADVAYAKFQPIRKEEYNTITIINKNQEVYKIPNGKSSDAHLKNINKIHNKLKKEGWNICKTNYKNQRLDIEFVPGESLENILMDNINNEEKVIEIIDNFIKEASKHCTKRVISKESSKEIKKVYSDDEEILILNNSLLDLNFGNVFVKDDKYTLIDQEWESDYDVPLDYTIYFSIKLLFEKIKSNSSLEKKLYKNYKITEKKQKCFNNMSIGFFEEDKKVNDKLKFIKLIEHGNITMNVKEETLEKDILFYKNLVEETKNGYEKEITRINNENNKKINSIQAAYEKEISRLNEVILEKERVCAELNEENNRLAIIEKNPLKYSIKKMIKKTK